MSDLVGFEVPKMDWTPGPDLLTRFKRFRQKCELLLDGPLKARDGTQKCKYVLLWSGDYGIDLFNTWSLTEDQQKDLKEYWKRFEDHVKPQANHILNRYYLRGLKQNNRPLATFLTEARLLIQSSGYPPDLHDELMRDTLVFGTDSEEVRRKCIARGNELTFARAKEIARTDEATQMQLKAMSDTTNPKQEEGEVNAISRGNKPRNQPHQRYTSGRGNRRRDNNLRQCYRCEDTPHTKDQQCPATGVECFNCNKRGHFSKVCKSKTRSDVMTLQKEQPDGVTSECTSYDKVFLGTLEARDSPSTSMIASIEQKEKQRTKVMTEIQVTVDPHDTHLIPIICKVDTGAEVNVISKDDYDRLNRSSQQIPLGPTHHRITAYGGHAIKTLGTCPLYVHQNGSIKEVVFNVTDVPGPTMLGCKTCEELELVKFNCSLETSKEDKETRLKEHRPCKPHQRTSRYPSRLDTETYPPLDRITFFNNFGDCFEGLGTFNMKPYHITLDSNAEPVIHAPRTVPVHLRDMFRKEINTMVELGVLIPVSEPTDWVNSVVLSETTNGKGEVTKIRVCLDPRDLNKAIKREHYYTKTIDEVVTQLSGAKFFSVVDAKKGYWHVPLDEASSYLTTFNTPFGRYRFTRLPFGLIVSQDVFQKHLDSALEGLKGVTGIADDTFIYGATEEEHDANMVNLMIRSRERGIKFNKDKVQLKCQEVSFFGHKWTQDGIKPDDSKISAIQKMTPPENRKDLQSFLGLVNYLTRYSGRLASLTAPLRELTKKDTAYVWGPEHDDSFNQVKQEITSMGVLRYFDPNIESVIQTDASQKGVGAVLLQQGQPVCYASKALTDTEKNYSNIERETLGVVWGLERFNYYIFGKHCTVNTDHKPLEAIFKKRLSSCPPRLQRFLMRALKYDVTVNYVKGPDVPIADALSRVSPQPTPSSSQLSEIYVHHVTQHLPATPTKLQQIRDETGRDPVLSLLKEMVFEGWPQKREECPQLLHGYWNFREELTIEDGLVLKGDRIVIPPTLRPEILNIIHQGHLGQEKCLLRARTSVFWPGITKEIINQVNQCEPCQKYQNKARKEPILQPEPPHRPWERLSSDLFEFRGQQYLLLTDQYSRFPVIRRLTSTTSSAVINHLKSIFAEHGIPTQLTTDNGPQYSSAEFKHFMNVYGVEHITSSPLYPQSNGFAERMVQTVENILQKCDENKEDPYLALLSYRATPLDHQLKSPAELLTNRKFKTRLPACHRVLLNHSHHEVMKSKLIARQEKQAHYYNQHSGPPKKPFEADQPIRTYNHHSQTWEPGTIVKPAKQPRSYIIRSSSTGTTYRRTRAQLKPDTTAVRGTQCQRVETPVYQGSEIPQQTTSLAPVSHTQTSHKNGAAPRPGSGETVPLNNIPQGPSDIAGGYVTRSGRTVTPAQRLDL